MAHVSIVTEECNALAFHIDYDFRTVFKLQTVLILTVV